MKFLYLKGSSERDVRLAKYIDCLSKLGHQVDFWGWERSQSVGSNHALNKCRYIYRAHVHGNGALLHYPIWMTRLFFALLFSKGLKEAQIVAVNFDAAFPTLLACAIRRVRFIYEIYDEFALSYRFPGWLKWFLIQIDHCIIRQARFVVHVDKNRVTYKCDKSIVIENSPIDYWGGGDRDYSKITKTFAVTGSLSSGRGVASICDFAEQHPEFRILMVGAFYGDKIGERAHSLPNVECHELMPQQDLFGRMKTCCGVFSLYDPTLEINRLAASNKVYDAMMMGIPVITNREVINSKFIRDNGVGVVLDYAYNASWDVLSDDSFVTRAIDMGKRGRALYLGNYQFDKMIKERFLPMVERTRKEIR